MNQTETVDSNNEIFYKFIVSNFEALGILIAEQKIDEIKICKIPKHIDIKRITLPQELKEIKPLNERDLSNFKESIVKFVSKLSSIYPKEYLKNLYNNLNSLKVKQKRIVFFNCTGGYSRKRNSIRATDDSIYHELMHMASNSPDRKHVGFFYSPYVGTYMGQGINEGYTELLTARHFNNNKVTCYSYESEAASIIESIIGSRMTELYFSSNLFGLIEELKKYSNEDEAMQFITNLDEFRTSLDMKQWYMIEPLSKEIYNYLIKIYYVFLKMQLDESKINENDFFELLNKFLDDYENVKTFSNDLVDKFRETMIIHR